MFKKRDDFLGELSPFKNNGIKLPQSFEEGTFIVEKGDNKNEWVVTNKAGEKVNITMPDNPKPGVIVIGKGDNLKHKSLKYFLISIFKESTLKVKK